MILDPLLTGTAVCQANGTSASITIPAAAAIGDLCLIAASYLQGSSGQVTLPTAPTGFSLVNSVIGTGGTFPSGLVVWSRTLVSGDPGSSVTIPSIANVWCGECRTYTTSGIDNNATTHTTSAASSFAPAAGTASQNFECAFTSGIADGTQPFWTTTSPGANPILSTYPGTTNGYVALLGQTLPFPITGGTLSTTVAASSWASMGIVLKPYTRIYSGLVFPRPTTGQLWPRGSR